jgi:gamma-glutamyl-gamma-aminobutyrate hydrolase PuuD
VTGRARDGIIEVLEGDPKEGFLLGLLFHPEFMFGRNAAHLKPYEALVRAAREHLPRVPGEHEIGLFA